MSKKLLPLIIALAFAFAGCLGIGDDDPEPVDDNGTGDDDHTNDDGDVGNGDDDGNGDGDNGAENETTEPPTAELTADLTSGTAPLNVTFTLDGEDPEGGELSWLLDLGDGSDPQDGSGLPATVTHSYPEAGNFTVTLEVFNEEHSTSTNLTITVEAPAAPEPILVLEGTTELFGSPAADPPLNALGCNGFLLGVNELDCVFFELESEHVGLDYTIDTESGALRHAFMTECSPTADEIEVHGGDVDEGAIPEDAGCIVLWHYGPATATFIVSIYPAV